MRLRPKRSLKAPKIGAAKNVHNANTETKALIYVATCFSATYSDNKNGRMGNTIVKPIAFNTVIPVIIQRFRFFGKRVLDIGLGCFIKIDKYLKTIVKINN